MKWMGLLLVFAFVLAFRLFFAYSTPYLTSGDAYLEFRMADHILQTGLPLFDDPLSWGGSTFALSPVFSYILALFGLVLPLGMVLKLMPNIFASLLVIPVFLIVYHSIKKYWIALLAALLASFVPIFISNTFNQVSPESLVVPVFFMALYAWLRTPDKLWTYVFVGMIILLSFLHPLSIVFVLGLFMYLILCAAERIKISSADFELLLFSLGFVVWAQFLLYKKAILFHGISVFWLNIPSAMMSLSFSRLSILAVLLQVGFFPLLVGSYVLYRNIFRTRRKDILLFFAMVFMVVLLLWLRLIPFYLGLMVLGILLVILFAEGFSSFQKFLSSTRVAHLKPFLTVVILLVVVSSLIVPSVFAVKQQLQSTITDDEVSAFAWVRDNTDSSDVVLAPVDMGHYLSAISGTKNVIDTQFMLHDDAEERYADVQRVYESVLETEVVGILDKYDATYILVPMGKDFLISDCFIEVFDSSIRVFLKDSTCHLRAVR
ncbi:hypothetical protein KY329_01600 [Candidatus Woesearchaeota archaeon]|nr:hypothetical protein [Candidatus Woesearchaeota archaeon]